jgi:Glyoxalase-like domain
MVRIGSVVLKVTDTRRAAGFWSQALGCVAVPGNAAFLVAHHGEGPRLQLDEDDRTYLDLWTANAEEQAAEVERLVSLDARRWRNGNTRTTPTSWCSPTSRATCSASSMRERAVLARGTSADPHRLGSVHVSQAQSRRLGGNSQVRRMGRPWVGRTPAARRD